MYDHQFVNYQQQQQQQQQQHQQQQQQLQQHQQQQHQQQQQPQYNMQYQQFNQYPQQMAPRPQMGQPQEIIVQTSPRTTNGNMQIGMPPQMPTQQIFTQNQNIPYPNVNESTNEEIIIKQEFKSITPRQSNPEILIQRSETEHDKTGSPITEISHEFEQNKHDEKPVMTIEKAEETPDKNNSSFNTEEIPIKTNTLSFEELLAQNLKNEGGIEDDVFGRPIKPVQNNKKSSDVRGSNPEKYQVVEHSPQVNSEDKESYLKSKLVNFY
jgi:hypothetical protein